MSKYTQPSNFKEKLGNAFTPFMDLIRFIRMNYVMDELWDGKEVLKFRRSGKTLVSISIQDNRFNALIIFGKSERAIFDTVRDQFSEYIYNYYDNSHTYHDGKWMFIDVFGHTDLDEIIELIKIKKKPNRKFNIKDAEFAQCGQRCDQCLLYIKNNELEKGNAEFHEMDWRCYHSEDEERVDYTNTTCPGCFNKEPMCCPEKVCLNNNGFTNCAQCNTYAVCRKNSHCFDPAECNLGLSAEEVTKAVLPYYSNYWIEKQMLNQRN